MKTVLIFDDTDVYEQKKLYRVLKATDVYLALWDIRQKLMDLRKQSEDSDKQVEYTCYQRALDEFYEALEIKGIDLDRELE